MPSTGNLGKLDARRAAGDRAGDGSRAGRRSPSRYRRFALKLGIGDAGGHRTPRSTATRWHRSPRPSSALGRRPFTVPSFVLGADAGAALRRAASNWLPSGGADSWLASAIPAGRSRSAPPARRSSRASRVRRCWRCWASPMCAPRSAKGVTMACGVVWRHALPNAAIPTVTIIGFMVGTPDRRRRGGRERVLVARRGPACWWSAVANRDLAVVQCHPAAGRRLHGDLANFTVDLALRLDRPAPALARWRQRREAERVTAIDPASDTPNGPDPNAAAIRRRSVRCAAA